MKHGLTVKRNYKDTLFRMIFQDKTSLMQLYNTISGNHHEDPEQLEIVTLDNAIFMNMKNDLAFVIDCSLCLYEHQSTDSPNIPLRSLFYVSREYEKMISQRTLYSARKIDIPAPCFVVFYNGIQDRPPVEMKRLSDLFYPKQDNPNLELIVKVININLGKNDALLRDCRTLFGYMQYIDRVRIYSMEMELRNAVLRAVNECIQEGILSEFLLQNKAEVIQMSIFEYDEERELKLIREDERILGREEGRQEGRQEGREEGKEYVLNLIVEDMIEDNISDEQILNKLTTRFALSETDSKRILESIHKTAS